MFKCSNEEAIAALKADGSVVTWGDSKYGGNSIEVQAQLAADVQHIYSVEKAFSALKADSSVIAWGNNGDQANAVLEPLSKLQEDGEVQAIACAKYATAALKADGSVATWGYKKWGGDCSNVQDQLVDVRSIYSIPGTFAAFKAQKFF